MPIYEYRCKSCGHVMEVWAKMSDPPPAECERCQSAGPEKIISRTAFQLKGGGWYAQGYGSSGKSGTAGSGSGSSDSGSSAGTTSSTSTTSSSSGTSSSGGAST